jgi:hypothetical protein
MQIQPTQAQTAAANGLESAILSQDGELAEHAINRAGAAGLHPVHEPFLILLIEAPWHSRHEDLVGALQDMRTPTAVGALERTAHARYKYLDYDVYLGLARKCTWALADIGTPEAHQALTRLAACDNPLIAGYANKRLTSWQKELPRKGRHFS